MSGKKLGWLAGFVAVLTCFFPGEARCLELDQTIWGFGTAPPGGQITLVSVLLRNDSPEAFEANVELTPTSRALGGGGTVLKEPVFIAPNTSRWVQFYPYREAHQTEWFLKCGSLKSFDLPSISSNRQYGEESKPLVSWLLSENATTAVRGAFPTFPAELFPPMVSGTGNLHIAVLNEAPRWDQPRREAFLQWLYRGGVLHLFHGPDGAFPQFSGELAPLNGEATEQRIGQGMVIRHNQGIGGAKLEEILPPAAQTKAENRQFDYTNQQMTLGNDELFRRLREFVAPQHQWPLIWLASIVYLLLIFPGGYLLGRARRDFRLVMGLQIGSALLFTYLFSVIGARGYNETSRNLAMAVARPVSDSKWNVSAWNNVFATSGGDYKISFPKRSAIFATGTDAGESLRGIISNGLEGEYLVDIPPYSSCTFLSSSVVDSPKISLTVNEWDPTNPRSLVCTVNSGWPPEANRAYAFFQRSLYTMRLQNGRLTVSAISSVDSNLAYRSPWDRSSNARKQDEDPNEWLNNQMFHLEEQLASSEGLRRISDGESLNDRILVMIPAPMPEACFPNSGVTGKPAGRILFCLDLPVPGSH